ncbi:hypothetical protein [Nocardioides psychrotolerans]|uniref:Uncharacterized protein n=1 Tax=Nocardioides psychrotolerans TaxID=1005945 RepID=A0A1I3CIZ3_9ACTN|nr:hypothetical protein [Nocardioides psychrotolerans]SFH74209.1 hypothetical protein SAMN05216561_10275 [Nocardioides psychrotolerans]
MELRPLSDPVGDPFFDVLRRRHRDVDVVLLPPLGPPDAADPVSDEVVSSTLLRVEAVARGLWSMVAPDSDDRPRPRCTFGTGPETVRATARLVTRRDDGFHVLVALRAELESDGWAVTRPDGPVERLVGYLDELTLTASYAEGSGTLLVELASESLPVGQDRARELTRPPVRPQAGGR